MGDRTAMVSTKKTVYITAFTLQTFTVYLELTSSEYLDRKNKKRKINICYLPVGMKLGFGQGLKNWYVVHLARIL